MIKKLILTFAFILLLLPLAAAAPGIPNWYSGVVTINNNAAADGTVITAKIDGIEVASTTTAGGVYGRLPAQIFFIPDENNNRAGKTIVFYVNDKEAASHAFTNGYDTQLDLAITTSSGNGGNGGGS